MLAVSCKRSKALVTKDSNVIKDLYTNNLRYISPSLSLVRAGVEGLGSTQPTAFDAAAAPEVV